MSPTSPENQAAGDERAVLHRMVMPKHVCPYGVKSKWLLERRGYAVEDHHLTTREETEAFKAEHGVRTTPQTFIGTERVGGYEALRKRFGIVVQADREKSYTPVLVVFGAAALMAWAASRRSGTARPRGATRRPEPPLDNCVGLCHRARAAGVSPAPVEDSGPPISPTEMRPAARNLSARPGLRVLVGPCHALAEPSLRRYGSPCPSHGNRRPIRSSG